MEIVKDNGNPHHQRTPQREGEVEGGESKDKGEVLIGGPVYCALYPTDAPKDTSSTSIGGHRWMRARSSASVVDFVPGMRLGSVTYASVASCNAVHVRAQA